MIENGVLYSPPEGGAGLRPLLPPPSGPQTLLPKPPHCSGQRTRDPPPHLPTPAAAQESAVVDNLVIKLIQPHGSTRILPK